MQVPGAGWARVQLARGQSSAQHWAIDGQYPEARLTIGSAPDAGWPVQSVGVMPYHFELFWDGRSLWVADTRRVGGVTLNGRPVVDWVQVRGRSEVSFGTAAMHVETADAMTNEMASSPGEAKRLTLSPGEGFTAASLGMPAQWDDSSLPGEATRVAPPPSESMGAGAAGGAWAEMDPESTRIAPEGAYPGLPPLGGVAPAPAKPMSAPPPPMLRPRLGGTGGTGAHPQVAPAQPPGRDMARTITADEMSHHLAAAQQIAAQGATAGDGGPSVVVQQGYPGVGGASGAPPQGFAPGGGFGAPQAPGGPQSGFAAPPSFDQGAAGGEKPKGKQSLPTRTWIMLAVTVLAAVGLMMMAPGAEEAAPVAQPGQPGQPGPVPAPLPQQGAQPVPGQPGAQPVPGQPVPGQAVAGQPGAQPVPLQQGAQPVPQPLPGTGPQPLPGTGPQPLPGTGPQPLPQPLPGTPDPTIAAPTTPTTPEPGTEADPAVPTGPTPDRIAADLVITGRYAEALPQYQALAAAHPERPEYAQMVRILQRRLAQRCQGGLLPDGRPCTGR